MTYSTNFTQFNGGAVGAPFVGNLANTSVTAGKVAFNATNTGIMYPGLVNNCEVSVAWAPGAGSVGRLMLRSFVNNATDDFVAFRFDRAAQTISLRFDDRRVTEVTFETKSFTFVTGTSYVMKLRANGRRIVASINGVIVLTCQTTTNQWGTFVGFSIGSTSDLLGTFTDFIHTPLPNPSSTFTGFFPEPVKFASNPIVTGAATVTPTNFFQWCVIDPRRYGAAPIVPARPYQAYYSDDHGSGSSPGGTYLATAASPLGPWIQYQSTPISTPPGGTFTQVETPDVFYDTVGSRFIKIDHAQGTFPNGGTQGTIWYTSPDSLNWTQQGVGAAPNTSLGLFSRGHTGYWWTLGRDKYGYWWGTTILGSRASGGGDFREVVRTGIWRTTPTFSQWQLWSEIEQTNPGAGIIFGNQATFIYKGDAYCFGTQFIDSGGSQFEDAGALFIGKFNKNLDGIEPKLLPTLPFGAAVAGGQAWEGTAVRANVQGTFVEHESTKDVLYIYYAVGRDPMKMGVATIDFPKNTVESRDGLLNIDPAKNSSISRRVGAFL